MNSVLEMGPTMCSWLANYILKFYVDSLLKCILPNFILWLCHLF